MIRRVLALVMVAGGLYLCVAAVSLSYGLLETYADPQLGLLANLGEFLGVLVLVAILGLALLAGGTVLVASPRVTVAVTVLATLALVASCWVGGELGIEAKERELSGVAGAPAPR